MWSGVAHEFLHVPILPTGDMPFGEWASGYLEELLGSNVVIYSHILNYSNFPQVAGPAGVASCACRVIAASAGRPKFQPRQERMNDPPCFNWSSPYRRCQSVLRRGVKSNRLHLPQFRRCVARLREGRGCFLDQPQRKPRGGGPQVRTAFLFRGTYPQRRRGLLQGGAGQRRARQWQTG